MVIRNDRMNDYLDYLFDHNFEFLVEYILFF